MILVWKRQRSVLTSAALAALVVMAACTSGGNNTSTTSHVLVVDKSFDMKTADPQREFEVSGGIVAKALYSTLLTFKGADSATPVPAVASSYTASSDAKTYTFKLRNDIKFGDGTQLTSADVMFSFNRLINIKGNPSFLLAGITVSAPDASTVVLTSQDPNPAIPFIIPNPALGIVNSKVVKAHGGTDQPGADKADTAESFLNSQSAGTGRTPPSPCSGSMITAAVRSASIARAAAARSPSGMISTPGTSGSNGLR